MEAVIDIDGKDHSYEQPDVIVTQLTVLQPRQSSSFERRIKSKQQNEGHDKSQPVPCEVIKWSLSGEENLNIQVTKSPRSSLKREQRSTENGKRNFLKSPCKLKDLSVDEISECLSEMGLEKYVDKFRDEDINGEQFVGLDEESLVELDVEDKTDQEKILKLAKDGEFRPKT